MRQWKTDSNIKFSLDGTWVLTGHSQVFKRSRRINTTTVKEMKHFKLVHKSKKIYNNVVDEIILRFIFIFFVHNFSRASFICPIIY